MDILDSVLGEKSTTQSVHKKKRLRTVNETRNLLNFHGGADGDRTHDLMNAIHALSQLSYSPTAQKSNMERRGMSKLLVPEVGIPSTCSGQAPRHGVEAPQDFEF